MCIKHDNLNTTATYTGIQALQSFDEKLVGSVVEGGDRDGAVAG